MTVASQPTVGDILARNPVWPGEGEPDPVIQPVMPARLPGQPEFPTPGIYFAMDEDVYHSIHAFSGSGAKKLGVSPMVYWEQSPLNVDREDEETEFKALGRAYHARICEGEGAYLSRYAVALDKADYPDALISTDDIKAAIIEAGEAPVTRIPTGQMKPAPIKADPDRMKPVTRGAVKDDLVAQLLEISPDAQIWDRLVSDHAAANPGRTMISFKSHKRIEMAARMIDADEQLRKVFAHGYPEVAIFWFDEKTGCPCKAKLDRLQLGAIGDLKSFSNAMERNIDRAVDFAIAAQKHYIGVMMYREAVEAAKRMIRERGMDAVAVNPFGGLDQAQIEAWCGKLAARTDPPECFWVYQLTGPAPVTRGRKMVIGSVATITDAQIQAMKRKYVECTKVFGAETPWFDIVGIRDTVDESVPMSATDFGEE